MEVRGDLAEAHRDAWVHLAEPGSWWTGEQRVEVAKTVRGALADSEPIPPWGSISAVDGRLPVNPSAPAFAHDVAYRIARHAGTLTEDWYTKASDELGPLPYVELVGIVTTVAAVSRFCRNIGVDVPDFPTPVAGQPTGDAPAEIVDPELNWVPVAAPADQTAAVLQAYSAVPGEFVNLWRMSAAQYMPTAEMGDPAWQRREGGLTRPQVELVASRISQLRECFY
jgi:hypothetical protein